MSIEELVSRAYTTWAHDKGTSWTDHMRAALAEAAQVNAAPAAVGDLIDSLPDDWEYLAKLMLNAGALYWKAAVRESGQGAVQWCRGDDGALFIFTRGEYADALVSAVASVTDPSKSLAAQVPAKRVQVTSDVVARLGGQRLCCDCGTVLAMDDGTMCGKCFSNRFGESYSSKPSVAQVPAITGNAAYDMHIRLIAAEAAQSVPVMERNQCDGCNRGLQVCDDGLHREPSGHPVMACTRNKYTRSIPATELASLREKAAMVDELRKDAERYRWLRCASNCDAKAYIDLYCDESLDSAIDAAIAKERQS